MKKMKKFNVGDKVFAKVKGYPAWPAQVFGVSGKKYDVKFYGTGETACLKPEDLFYYLKHKVKFAKTHKRKDYNEAVEQIEAEIEEAGTDGNPESNDDCDTTVDLDESQNEPKKNNKRKRLSSGSEKSSKMSKVSKPISEETNEEVVKKAEEKKEEIEKEEEIGKEEEIEKKEEIEKEEKIEEQEKIEKEEEKKDNESVEELKEKMHEKKVDEDSKEDNVGEIIENDGQDQVKEIEEKEVKIRDIEANIKDIEEKIRDEKNISETADVIEKKDSKNEVNKNGDSTEIMEIDETPSTDVEEKEDVKEVKEDENMNKEYDLVPEIYLTTYITYANKIRENEDIFKSKDPDPISLDNGYVHILKVFPVKISPQKYVGIKVIFSPIKQFKSEYERALDDEKKVLEILELKKEILSNENLPESDLLIKDLVCQEKDIYQMDNRCLLNYKKSKLQMLKNESQLYKCTLAIKRALALDKAYPEEAHENLVKILEMEIDSLSLLKHPTFLDTIKRLRKYVGNVKAWSLNEKELEYFQDYAKKIRNISIEVYKKMTALFPYHEQEDFSDLFKKDCQSFRENTKDFKESQVFALCSLPDTRKYILEQIYDNSGTMENED